MTSTSPMGAQGRQLTLLASHTPSTHSLRRRAARTRRVLCTSRRRLSSCVPRPGACVGRSTCRSLHGLESGTQLRRESIATASRIVKGKRVAKAASEGGSGQTSTRTSTWTVLCLNYRPGSHQPYNGPSCGERKTLVRQSITVAWPTGTIVGCQCPPKCPSRSASSGARRSSRARAVPGQAGGWAPGF